MKTKFWKLIQKYCIDHDITMKQFANELEMSQANFSAILNGNRKISEQFIQRLAELMKVTPDALKQHLTASAVTYTAK